MRYLSKGLIYISIITLLLCSSGSEEVYAQQVAEMDEDTVYASGELEGLSAQAVVLMELTTGKVIYEENADVQLAPASVTKIMTLLLIFDALEEEKIALEDMVTVSEYAASMGGSQIYLEMGETQTVDTMIKAIAVSSANDACVAMAEYICGTSDAFVVAMNQRAKGLGMTNTNFVNCNGLDTEGHVTTARDIALMSMELMNTYPEVTDYTMIWMETITHVTSKGSSEFGLSSTNKLLQEYEYTTGLKTGSTDEAKFCVSATASKDGIDLVAVVMAAPTSTERIEDAITLLDYGFSQCQVYEDDTKMEFDDIEVTNGTKDNLTGGVASEFYYVDTEGNDVSMIEKIIIYDEVEAPVYQGDKVGIVNYILNNELIGTVDIVSLEEVDEMNLYYALLELIPKILL